MIKAEIASRIFYHRTEIHEWFEKQFLAHPAPFYSSVDIRDSGEKIAPVDSNLFPAGFNNICEIDDENAPAVIQGQIDPPKKIVIISERNTQNRFYIQNLVALKSILERCGSEVQIGWVGPPNEEFQSVGPVVLTAEDQQVITAFPIRQIDGTLILENSFNPDLILLNNDFSQGYPKAFEAILQPIAPSFKLGWHRRRKSDHFARYNRLAQDFSELIGLDPWHITIDSAAVGPIDFSTGIGMEMLLQTSEAMLSRLSQQHQKRKIARPPALFIKNDSGTYGMGIMVIENLDELRNLNRRTKNKMSMGKNNRSIDQVVVQEGIPTQVITDGHASEPVIYMMGKELVGGFIRANTERDELDNLNSSGMIFKKLCFKDLQDQWTCHQKAEFPELESVYGVIAKLSTIAAAQEQQEILNEKRN